MSFAKINPVNRESEGLILCSYTDTLKINKIKEGFSVKPRELIDFLHINNEKEIFKDLPMDEQVLIESILPRLITLNSCYKENRLNHTIRTMQLAMGLG